jgi:putative transposase
MARKARIVAVGCAHHVTQRGNNREIVFRTPAHSARYLDLLARHATQEGLDILGYCLMTNHVHLVVIPQGRQSLARALRRAHGEYAQFMNRSYHRSGHLWQNRLYSCALDERHLWTALRYVEQNPVRAQMVRRAEEWGWSSARDHLDLRTGGPVTLRMAEWRQAFTPEEWASCLNSVPDEEEVTALRAATRNGWALGSEEFCRKLEPQTRRPVKPQPTGRPRYEPAVAAGLFLTPKAG